MGLGESLLDPGHRRVFRVFDLQPVRRLAGAIGAVPMFRNQSLEPELASLAEQMRADFALLEGCEEDPIWPPFQQPREVGFAQAQWQLAQIITVERQAIERVKLNLGVVLSGAETPSTPRTTALAIDDELLAPILERSLGDPREALRPVIATTGDQPDPVAVTLHSEAVTVIFDFVEPLGAGRHDLSGGRDAELELGHGRKIRSDQPECQLPPGMAFVPFDEFL
jgi:hypothetical protein